MENSAKIFVIYRFNVPILQRVFDKGIAMLAQKLYKYNPLDDIECLFAHQQHTTERRNSHEIVVEISGKWDNMLLFFAWEENLNCLDRKSVV